MAEEKMIILRMVQDGKITAAEGLALLEALAEGERRVREGEEQQRCVETPERGTTPEAAGAGGEEPPGPPTGGRAPEGTSGATPWPARMPPARLAHSLSKLGVKLSGLGGLAALGGLCGMGPGIEVSETFAGEFDPTAAVVGVTLETRNGGVTVRPWSEPGYKVVAVKRVRSGDESEAREVSAGAVLIEDTGRELTIRANEEHLVSSVSLTVYLPAGRQYRILAQAQNGGVNVTGISCERCQAGTTNGGVKIAGLTAMELEATSTNGGVGVDGVRARSARVKTTNGQIRWNGAALKAALETVNGGVQVCPCSASQLEERVRGDWPAGEASYTVESVNGRIAIDLRDDWREAHISFTAETRQGRIRVPEAWRVQRSGSMGFHEVRGEFAGGTSERLAIAAETCHGAITVTHLTGRMAGNEEAGYE